MAEMENYVVLLLKNGPKAILPYFLGQDNVV